MEDCSNLVSEEEIEPDVDMGLSESKGSKKKGEGKTSKGIATSFGFRRRPASSSRVDNIKRQQQLDSNGNKGLTDETENVCDAQEPLSGRSTPLSRARKDTPGAVLHRSNRFGLRQQTSNKTAKVADIGLTAEPAFRDNNNHFQCLRLNNNNPDLDKQEQCVRALATKYASQQQQQQQKAIKQTVIVTYAPKQYTTTLTNTKPNPRSQSASRAFDYGRASDYGRATGYKKQYGNGRIAVHSDLLPELQVPVRGSDVKSLKQVANNTRKISSSSDGSSREGSVIDSNGSPASRRRRPRSLQLVMKGAHTFHLKELHLPDLDVMDEALVTDHTIIPLPKFPTSFESDRTKPALTSQATFIKPNQVIINNVVREDPDVNEVNSKISLLEKYRKMRNNDLNYREEKKIEIDRQQKERVDKQNSFTRPDQSEGANSRKSSEESPSGSRSDATTWHQQGGESMANRSQDDASVSFSLSSCDEDQSKRELLVNVQLTTKTFIVDAPFCDKSLIEKIERSTLENSVHPMLCKAVDLNYKKTCWPVANGKVSMSGSAYSSTSTATNTDLHHIAFTQDETNFNVDAIDTHSLLDEETSPADSLISSTSRSDSSNDIANLDVERDEADASSAYLTANTKTKSSNTKEGEEIKSVEEIKEVYEVKICNSPGTPTHASGSLSLSDGKDYFDDEIADQPALTLHKSQQESEKMTQENKRHLLLQEKAVPSPRLRQKKLGSTIAPSESVASLDTVSSLASDDLMLDDNLGRSMTSLQSVQDYVERLDSSIRSGLNSLDEHQLKKELDGSKCAVKQWNRLLEQNRVLDRELVNVCKHSSTTSITSIGASLPARTARLLSRSRIQSPLGECPAPLFSDGKEQPTSNLLQDVVDIKSLLLQLKRVLHESETVDPLSGEGAPVLPHSDHTAELRKQILFLQSQLEERDRLVKMLQDQMSRLSDSSLSDDKKSRDSAISEDMCTVATQTERLRPSISSNLTHADNPGLVSWSEQLKGRKITEDTQNKMKAVKMSAAASICTCGASNFYTNGHTQLDIESLKTSREGSRYLQVTNRNSANSRYKRDLSVNERNPKLKNFSNSRSKSIENFKNHSLSYSTEDCQIGDNVEMPKHMSYTDLYNGSVKECKVNSKQTNGNSNSSEMDDNSVAGYKSLPPSSLNGKKISCIPRRSVDSKLVCPKNGFKASAV